MYCMMIVHCLQGLRLSVAGALPMKINFTKKEYQTLVEMLLTADWVIRSHEEVFAEGGLESVRVSTKTERPH